jgi:hypothetical protein
VNWRLRFGPDNGPKCRRKRIPWPRGLLRRPLRAQRAPRLALFAVWLFSDLLSRAYDAWVVPFVGFFLLPWTTLAYAVMWDSSERVHGFEWFVVALAFLADLAPYWSREARRRRS